MISLFLLQFIEPYLFSYFIDLITIYWNVLKLYWKSNSPENNWWCTLYSINKTYIKKIGFILLRIWPLLAIRISNLHIMEIKTHYSEDCTICYILWVSSCLKPETVVQKTNMCICLGPIKQFHFLLSLNIFLQNCVRAFRTTKKNYKITYSSTYRQIL